MSPGLTPRSAGRSTVKCSSLSQEPRESSPGVNRTLRRLVEHGIVESEEAGAAILYRLNRKHLAAPAVAILAGLRGELIRRIERALRSWKIQAFHASLFGSAARADGNTASDVDLFLVRAARVDADNPTWRAQVDRLVIDVQRWTGNRVGLSEVSKAEGDRLRRMKPAVVKSLRADAISLFGPPITTVLGK